MSRETDRRKFLRDSTLIALGGVAAGLGFSQEAMAKSKPLKMKTIRINPQARVLMPNGKIMTREQLMTKLGLDPGVRPDAWLNITKCTVNAGALRMDQRQLLMKRGMRFKGQELIKGGMK